MYKLWYLLCAVVLVSCGTQPLELTLSTEQADNDTAVQIVHRDDTSVVQAQVGDANVTIHAPLGWEALTTDFGVILSEYATSVADGGNIDGMLVYVFLPDLDDFDLSGRGNVAQAMLQQVVRRPAYVGTAAVNQPQAFEWDGYDAAYYTLNSGDGTVTMLIATVLDPASVVAYNISVPMNQANRLRAMLPEVLAYVAVDEHELTGAALDNLPNNISFPAYDLEVASDNTPANP